MTQMRPAEVEEVERRGSGHRLRLRGWRKGGLGGELQRRLLALHDALVERWELLQHPLALLLLR